MELILSLHAVQRPLIHASLMCSEYMMASETSALVRGGVVEEGLWFRGGRIVMAWWWGRGSMAVGGMVVLWWCSGSWAVVCVW